MATLKEVLQYAKNNPEDPRNVELYKQIRAGSFDQKAVDEGVDLSEVSPSFQSKAEDQGLVKNFITSEKERFGDVVDTAKGIVGNIKERTGNVVDIVRKSAAGERSPIKSGFDVAGEVVTGVADTAGEIIIGGAKMALPESQEQKIAQVFGEGVESVVETEGVQTLLETYNSLPEDTKRDLQTAGQLSSALLEIVTLGGAKAVTPAVKRTVGEALDSIQDQSTKFARGVGKSTEKLKGVGKAPQQTPEQATGQVIQGKTTDIKRGQEALQSLDTSGVETFKDLDKKINDDIGNLAKKVDEDLGADATKIPLSGLKSTLSTKSGKEVSTNFVDTALNQLDELYEKTGDIAAKADIEELIQIAKTEGLTRLEVNDIARTYGREFSEKAFTKAGEPRTSVNSQMFENTRKGVKDVARQGITGDAAKQADEMMSKLYSTQRLVKKNVEAVNKLQQKIQERGLFEKVGHGLAKYADVLTGGTIRGLVGGLLPRGAGYKTLNALDLESLLKKNLDIIQDAQKTSNIKQLESKVKNLSETSFNSATVPKTVGSLTDEAGKFTNTEMDFVFNTKKADLGQDFAQEIEPAGRYMNIGFDEFPGGEGMKKGKITFKKPFVIEWETSRKGGWKTKLSEQYNGKTGKELSKALKEDGFDGVITLKDFRGSFEPVEAVSLQNFKN